MFRTAPKKKLRRVPDKIGLHFDRLKVPCDETLRDRIWKDIYMWKDKGKYPLELRVREDDGSVTPFLLDFIENLWMKHFPHSNILKKCQAGVLLNHEDSETSAMKRLVIAISAYYRGNEKTKMLKRQESRKRSIEDVDLDDEENPDEEYNGELRMSPAGRPVTRAGKRKNYRVPSLSSDEPNSQPEAPLQSIETALSFTSETSSVASPAQNWVAPILSAAQRPAPMANMVSSASADSVSAHAKNVSGAPGLLSPVSATAFPTHRLLAANSLNNQAPSPTEFHPPQILSLSAGRTPLDAIEVDLPARPASKPSETCTVSHLSHTVPAQGPGPENPVPDVPRTCSKSDAPTLQPVRNEAPIPTSPKSACNASATVNDRVGHRTPPPSADDDDSDPFDDMDWDDDERCSFLFKYRLPGRGLIERNVKSLTPAVLQQMFDDFQEPESIRLKLVYTKAVIQADRSRLEDAISRLKDAAAEEVKRIVEKGKQTNVLYIGVLPPRNYLWDFNRDWLTIAL